MLMQGELTAFDIVLEPVVNAYNFLKIKLLKVDVESSH